MIRIACELALCSAIGFAVVANVPTYLDDAPTCRIEVTARDGNVYIAGSGNTIQDAWTGARVPADWIEIINICE